jgi:hypothetical protein
MKTSELFPSKWLKGDDLNGETPNVKIKAVTEEVVGRENETKHVVYFEGIQKGLVLNRTNSDIIETLYGDETDDWAGQEVQLYSVPVSFQGRTTNSVRCRASRKVQAKRVAEALDDKIPF